MYQQVSVEFTHWLIERAGDSPGRLAMQIGHLWKGEDESRIWDEQ